MTQASNAKIDMLLNMVSGGVQNTIGGVRTLLTQEPKDEEIAEAIPPKKQKDASEASKVKQELLKEIDPQP